MSFMGRPCITCSAPVRCRYAAAFHSGIFIASEAEHQGLIMFLFFGFESLPTVCTYVRAQPLRSGCTNMLLSYAVLHMSPSKCEMTDLAKGMTHWQLTVIGFPPVD